MQNIKTPPKLCFILPLYDEEAWGNQQYKYRFVEKIALVIDVFLVFEAGEGIVRIDNVKNVFKQRAHRKPFNQIELFILLLRARMSGYKTFYSHFSIRGALYARILTFLLGGKSYLFHCAEFRKKDLSDSFFKKARFYWVLKHVHSLVTTSPLMRKHYAMEFGVDPNRILLMPNYVDTQSFRNQDKRLARSRLGLDQEKKVVLFVHQLSKAKGAHHIPQIAKSVMKKIPEVIFLVVGGPGTANDVSETLENEVHNYGLEEVIRIEGYVPNKYIQTYFSAADVFIMPSDMEGFGIVLLEAMVSGVPFVSTDGGGPVNDVVSAKQKKYVVPSGDMVAFANGVISLLSDQRERTRLSEEGKFHVRKYSIEEVSNIFLKKIISK